MTSQRRPSFAGLALVALTLVLGCRAEELSLAGGSSAGSTTAPRCDDPEVQLTLIATFDAHHEIQLQGEEGLLSIGQIEETGTMVHTSSAWRERRRCKAVGQIAPGNKSEFLYDILVPREHDGIGYRVKACFASLEAAAGSCEGFRSAPSP